MMAVGRRVALARVDDENDPDRTDLGKAALLPA